MAALIITACSMQAIISNIMVNIGFVNVSYSLQGMGKINFVLGFGGFVWIIVCNLVLFTVLLYLKNRVIGFFFHRLQILVNLLILSNIIDKIEMIFIDYIRQK